MYLLKKQFRYFLSILLFSFLLTSFAFSSSKTTFSTYKAVFYLIYYNYVNPIKGVKILNGSIDGINYVLKKHKIKYKIPHMKASSDDFADLEKFEQLYKKILRRYKNQISEKELLESILLGVGRYLDPYTVYMPPKEFKILQEQMKGGDFGGIGVYIGYDWKQIKKFLKKGQKEQHLTPEQKKKLKIMVIEPIEGTPAYKAGLRSGDYIIAVDGKNLIGKTPDIAQNWIRGKVGTKVILTIDRKGKIFKVPIVRGFIHVNSVVSKMYGNIGYLRVRFFGGKTNIEFYRALRKVLSKGAKGIIIDLRNNGGGYMDAAVSLCGNFIPLHSLVVYLVDRKKQRQDYYTTNSPIVSKNIPVVLLVNKYTASASEITSGCFQDYKRGIVIGTKTYGKACVQTITPLSNGAAIKITIANYYTPKGRDLSKTKIIPDIKVEMETDELVPPLNKDTQLKKALNYIKSKIK